jgi:hypothetical protein
MKEMAQPLLSKIEASLTLTSLPNTFVDFRVRGWEFKAFENLITSSKHTLPMAMCSE